MRRWTGLAAALTFLLTALPALAAPAGAAAAGASRCTRPAPAGTTTRTLTVDGHVRSYLLSVPARYSGKVRVPVVFDFHGTGETMQQQDVYSQMSAKAGARGWIVVTPQSLTFGKTTAWVFPALSHVDTDFVAAMVHTVSTTLCVDARRLYTTGISNGAGFSDALLCALPGTFAASAPVAGVNITKPCAPGTPHASVLAFHGTGDPVVPYNGGAVLGSGLRVPSVATAVSGFVTYDACRARPVVRKVASDVDVDVFRGCAQRTTVALYTILGGGHTWPGAAVTVPLGPTTHSIDATKLMLRFFATHPKRG